MKLFITEKPSVAQQFAAAMDVDTRKWPKHDGYIETDRLIITWCVGHLVALSYPEAYDPALKKWDFSTLPFIPAEWKYEVSKSTEKQFQIVAGLLNRSDVDTIYVCTDSAREGEYIYRLVDMMAKVDPSKERRRVWIDSQTREEIRRGIREAKPDSAYDHLSEAAFSRAKEDYLMGINFSRALTLKYRNNLKKQLNIGPKEKVVIAVGRVMTCVLGMIVKREQEIRAFQKTTFYRIQGKFDIIEQGGPGAVYITADWKPSENSKFYPWTDIYDGKGFLLEGKAVQFMKRFMPFPDDAVVLKLEKRRETKNPPLLYNLAELQNDCAKLFKIDPDKTLAIAQELYEKKLTTYPRTDARVLSSAVAKEIDKNIRGVSGFAPAKDIAEQILTEGRFKNIVKTKYTDDKKISDHYAIIPTGQGEREFASLSPLSKKVYELIVRRFLSIFMDSAVYEKLQAVFLVKEELFIVNTRALKTPGYLVVADPTYGERNDVVMAGNEQDAVVEKNNKIKTSRDTLGDHSVDDAKRLSEALLRLRKGQHVSLITLSVKPGETAPPKRYTSGSMILAMENAGNLIEDEDLRAQIKGAGIGTSATRAGILTKLVVDKYISLDKKTQILSPTKLGEYIAYYVKCSVPHLLNPKLTASWEMGLSEVAEGTLTEAEYMEKLEQFVREKTEKIRNL